MMRFTSILLVLGLSGCESPTQPIFDNPLDSEYVGPVGPVLDSAWPTGIRLSWKPGTSSVDGYFVERTSSIDAGHDERFNTLSGLLSHPVGFADSTLADLRPHQYRIRAVGPDGPMHSSVLTVEFPRFVLPVQQQHVIAVAFSPDGRRTATVHAGDNPENGSTLRIWEDENEIHRIPTSQWASRDDYSGYQPTLPMKFSPDGRYLVVADHFVTVVDLADNGRTYEFSAENRVGRIAFHPDGRSVGLLMADYVMGMDVRRLPDGVQQTFFFEATVVGRALDAAFTPNGAGIVVAFSEAILTWPLNTLVGETIAALPSSADLAQFSSNGQTLVTKQGEALYVWEVPSGRLRHVTSLAGDDPIHRLSFSSDLTRFAAIHVRLSDLFDPRPVRLYRLEDGGLYRTLPVLPEIHHVSLDGSMVYASYGNEHAIWNLEDAWRAASLSRR